MILKEGSWKNMLNMEINKSRIELGLGKLYAIWLREFKVFLREKSRLNHPDRSDELIIIGGCNA